MATLLTRQVQGKRILLWDLIKYTICLFATLYEVSAGLVLSYGDFS
ncbi:hypothetical protein DSOL_4892 [Desulfosporosinus metallidurans]|uniref:Uncharacterized protein n=1 Tax=Desulfosporosinus metallidurans TaxID=1888891 RepID=A0A1Q8QH62_9FIRM|nr:hypothetical protein DSOL_4892 [Desulfosporosinus metallidurans]